MSLRATSDTILIKLSYDSKAGNIFVPDQAKQYSGNFWGIVESVGPACSFRNEVKKGDKVKLVRHEGFKVICGVEEFMCVSERWIVAKEEK